MTRKQLRQNRINLGLCIYCGLAAIRDGLKSCQICAEKVNKRQTKWIKNHNQYNKQYRDKAKLKVFNAYGNKCNCCLETDIRFLSIDHVKQDGAKYRLELGNGKKSSSSYTLQLWAIKNNYPDSLQLLCYNCNFASFLYGVCPHKLK